MNSKTANKIYDILVLECGARESERERFVDAQTAKLISEWRFCGNLGFGGKFWRHERKWFGKENRYVNCYEEDLTLEREIMLLKANIRLREC